MVRLRFLRNKWGLVLGRSLGCLFSNAMQLSREALNSLEAFRLEPYTEEDVIRNAVQGVVDHLLQNEMDRDFCKCM